jgi:hypothetical protein
MPARKTTSGLPDKTEFTILDVILRLEHLEKALHRHTTVDESLEKVYREVHNSQGEIHNKLDDLETRFATMSSTFINLVKRLNTIIDIKERP